MGMAYFAKIEDGLVTQVIAVGNKDCKDADGNESEQVGRDFIASLKLDGDWKRTSYNTRGGKHYDPDTNQEDNGVAFRKNYAGIGYRYDEERDAFIPPSPFESWLLDEDTCNWNAPKPMPETELNDDGRPSFLWKWDEEQQDWVRWDFPDANHD